MDHARFARRWMPLVSLVACLLLAVPSVALPSPASPARTAAEIYAAGCAACHGPDGRGAPKSTVGFDVPLPDFTECRPWPREADVDWYAVIHDGGPARAFDPIMPAFGQALSHDEIMMAISHVRNFCRDKRWPRGELNLPRPLVTEKAFPEDEVVATTSIATEGPGDSTTKLIWEQRIGARTQWEAVVPIPAFEQDGNWTGGVGDIALAVKQVLHHRPYKRIVSVIGELGLPTGSEASGTGGGVTTFEPTLVYGEVIGRQGFVQAQAGVGFSSNHEKANNEALWRATVGRTFYQGLYGRMWSPMLEVLGARELTTDSSNEWDVAPQVQISLSTRHHVRLNVGLRLPVTEAGPRPTRFLTYVLWDWFDGGLLQGW